MHRPNKRRLNEQSWWQVQCAHRWRSAGHGGSNRLKVDTLNIRRNRRSLYIGLIHSGRGGHEKKREPGDPGSHADSRGDGVPDTLGLRRRHYGRVDKWIHGR